MQLFACVEWIFYLWCIYCSFIDIVFTEIGGLSNLIKFSLPFHFIILLIARA